MSGKSVRQVMSAEVISVGPATGLSDVAELMARHDIGDVLVLDNGRLAGIVTDRDLVVRGIAQQRDPRSPVKEVLSQRVAVISADEALAVAEKLMRDNGVRRLPVVEEGRVVGVVSMGDISCALDPGSALADISGAPPNN